MKRVSQHDEAAYKTNLKIKFMSYKAFVAYAESEHFNTPANDLDFHVYIVEDGTTFNLIDRVLKVNYSDMPTIRDLATIRSLLEPAVLGLASDNSLSMSASDIVYLTPCNFNQDEEIAIRNGILTKSFSAASRSLNSAFQISTTRDSLVSYSIDISTSVSLSGGAVGTIFLEYADNSGISTNVVEVGRFVNGNTGTLVIGLTLNQTATGTVSGMIPKGKYVRIRTANTTGTPTFNYRSGQEVLA